MPKDTQGTAEFVTLSRPDSHLIPLRVNTQGKYVTASAGKFTVLLEAVFPKDEEHSFPGNLKGSEIIFSRFVYVGTLYPDGSSLPFIPVGNASITTVEKHNAHHDFYEDGGYDRYRIVESSKSNDSDPSFKAVMDIPLSTWSNLLRLLASSEWFSRLNVKHHVKAKKKESFIPCHVQADREVTVCLNGIWFTKRLKDAMKDNGKLRATSF